MEPEGPTVPWPSLLPFTKTWSKDFTNIRVPGDRPFVEELRTFNPTSEGVRLFLEAYNEDISSFDSEAVVNFCHDTFLRNIREQSKPGSAWMDDRTHTSYCQGYTLPLAPAPDIPVSPLATPAGSLLDQTISRALRIEYRAHAFDSIVPPGVTRILNGNRGSIPSRYVPDSRRYPAPLTAELLYENLKKQVNRPAPKRRDRKVVNYLAFLQFARISFTHHATVISLHLRSLYTYISTGTDRSTSATAIQNCRTRIEDWCK
jgi:hypothetical protein